MKAMALSRPRSWVRLLAWGGGSLLLIVAVAVLAAYLVFRASLPQLDGELAIPGLRAEVGVERDAMGVPTLKSANRRDLAQATLNIVVLSRFDAWQHRDIREPAARESSQLAVAGGISLASWLIAVGAGRLIGYW